MPKISEERKSARRDQILEGARRCFAEYGYEGATVSKLENEIGLSRGAIFNYFPSKEDLFIELAVRDSARMSEIWINEGLEAVVREVMELDPAWLSVYLVLNGLALMRAGGEELPSTDLVLELLGDAIGPDRSRTPVRTSA